VLKQEHSKIHDWYHGTIDETAADDGAGIDINPTPPPPPDLNPNTYEPWYDHDAVPARTDTGWRFSLLAADAGIGVTRPGVISGRGQTPGGDGTDSEDYDPLILYNGDFQIVDSLVGFLGLGHAGWRYQGGSTTNVDAWDCDGSCVLSSNYYFTIDADESPLVHNWMFIDPSVKSLHLDHRVTDPGGTLTARLIDEQENVVATLGNHNVNSVHDWEDLAFAIPVGVRSRSLRLEISFSGDGATDIDELRFVPEPSSVTMLWAGAAMLGLLFRARHRAGRVE
jgi:hypothetical protein